MVCIQEQQALVGGAPRGPAEFTLVKIERFGQNINRGQRHRRIACYAMPPLRTKVTNSAKRQI